MRHRESGERGSRFAKAGFHLQLDLPRKLGGELLRELCAEHR
jgi:hypothetical protein